MSNANRSNNLPMPQLRLVMGSGGAEYKVLSKAKKLPPASIPSILISYAYIKGFMKRKKYIDYSEWVMDSGAFTAYNIGKPVEIHDYIRFCKMVMGSPDPPAEIFALDVIGDWRASLRNYELMLKAGIPIVPIFHYGEPFEMLRDISQHCEKISLGGCATITKNVKKKWYEQAFARTWPKKIHGLGLADKDLFLSYPWASTDASTWIVGCFRYGRYSCFNERLSIRGFKDLRCELEYYLRLQRAGQSKWKKVMEDLGQINTE